MTCLRETATNAHNLDRLDMANHDTILLGWNKCKRNIAYGMFLVGHSSMGECALAECAPAESSFLNSRIDSLKPVSISASFVAVDQYYGHGCSSSELGSGVVLAINDKESVDTSMGVLNTIMDDDDKDSVDASKRTLNDIVDEFDNSLTNDHESAFLYMMDMPDVQPGQTSGEGVEESKTGDCSDSDDTVKVVRNTFATPAEAALIRSGAVTVKQLRMCEQEQRNRRSPTESTPSLSEHAHDQAMGDSTTTSLQEGESLQVLDTHLEHIYTYERDGSECKPGGAPAAHPGSDSETVTDDDDGNDVQQPPTSPPGGVPATRMHVEYAPDPEQMELPRRCLHRQR